MLGATLTMKTYRSSVRLEEESALLSCLPPHISITVTLSVYPCRPHSAYHHKSGGRRRADSRNPIKLVAARVMVAIRVN